MVLQQRLDDIAYLLYLSLPREVDVNAGIEAEDGPLILLVEKSKKHRLWAFYGKDKNMIGSLQIEKDIRANVHYLSAWATPVKDKDIEGLADLAATIAEIRHAQKKWF